ncbi:butyrophilin subfamily 1 member A1-like [Nyctibius grandis]|uniref:butyrophilin subfamily 1 member A1-like n=1 Tax=Nyctibius grandis TaxID=48427 RepID=UPI0035BBFC4E
MLEMLGAASCLQQLGPVRWFGGISGASFGGRCSPSSPSPLRWLHHPPSASLPHPLLQLRLQMWFLRDLLSCLVTLQVFQLGSADFRVVGPDRPLHATVGQDVVLPCHLSPRVDARRVEIRWIRQLSSETVHHYQNGEDQYVEQMKEYAGRTELVRDGLSGGRLDLRIIGLRPSDDGEYVCTVKDAASYGEAIVDLEVTGLI